MQQSAQACSALNADGTPSLSLSWSRGITKPFFSAMQLGMALMVNPPKEGSESYAQWKEEESSVMDSLRRRAQIMTDGFNACEGVSCTFTEGAMYSFPRLDLPQKVSHAARRMSFPPQAVGPQCISLVTNTTKSSWIAESGQTG